MVTQTLTSVQLPRTDKYMETLFVCKPVTTTYQTMASDLVNHSMDNDIDRRVKPESLSMTPMQEQYKIKRSRGFYYDLTISYDYACSPRATVKKRTYKRPTSYYSIPIPGTYPGETNWMLKARNDIKNNVVNLGATLVEYRATSSMFYNAGIGLRNAWLRFKRKKHSRKKLRPCDVAASELWYSYGVAPLVSDLTASYERLSERLLKPVVVRVTSFDQVKDSGKKIYSLTEYEWDWHVTQRAIIYAKLNPDNFTIGNLPELVWERIPFSFVVDWMSNIGDTLSSLDALSGVTSITGVVSTKTKYKHVGRIIPSETRVPIRDELYERTTHEREVLTTIPLPRLPSWQPSKSWVAIRHAVSLLTVLNQRCQKKAPTLNLDILRRN